MSHSLLRVRRQALTASLLAIVVPALAACGGTSSFAPSAQTPSGTAVSDGIRHFGSTSWNFTTLDDPNNPSYSELLGINNEKKICGFAGRGTPSSPATGFCLAEQGNAHFRAHNYPTALDTYVTSLNNTKAIAGWYLSNFGPTFGFILQHGVWTSYKDLKLRKGHTNLTEILGINDAGLAVGFYTDDAGNNHGFELNSTVAKYHPIIPPGGVSVEATGINGKGDIVGLMTTGAGETKSFLLKGGSFTLFSYPGSKNTQALAVNWQDQVVGSWVDSSGNTHAFLLTDPLSHPVWTSIDEPKAAGPTVLTSVEDHDYMVGYYVDSVGNTNGFFATPAK